ncbi:MAG: hypothetical protein H7Y41_01070 [Hyphomonadaceae bacterium]|nr:hypothetical protein [Clostridia bacterium]
MDWTGMVSKMKRILYVQVLIAVFLVGWFCNLIFTQGRNAKNINLPTQNQVQQEIEITRHEKAFLIKWHEGKIGIFENDQLVDSVPVNLEVLRKDARLEIEKGIRVDTMEEVTFLLEELTS